MSDIRIIQTSDVLSVLITLEENSDNFKRALKNFNFMIDYAIEEKTDVFIITGNVLSNPISDNIKNYFITGMKKLEENNIIVIINDNNQDLPENFKFGNIFVINQPELLRVKTNNLPLQVIVIPSYQENYEQILDSFLEQIDNNLKTILVSNVCVSQCSLGDEIKIEKERPESINLPEIKKDKLDYVALGGIMKAQILWDRLPVSYSGSIFPIFSQKIYDDKYFVEFVLTNNKPTFSFDNFISLPEKEFLK